MKNPLRALKVASALFMAVCVLHVLRLVFSVELSIDRHAVGLWPSLIVIVVTFGLSLWFARLACHSGQGGDEAHPPADM